MPAKGKASNKKERTGRGGFKPVSKNPKIVNPNRAVPKSATHLRDKATINRLAMYKQTAVRDRDGHFLGGVLMSKKHDERIKRIQPDRRWFGNTRTVGQQDLTKFRDEMTEHVNDPYTMVIRQSKLPLALLGDPYKNAKMNLLTTESFSDTFGKKKVRDAR
jgi:nuclear GTP-binding protein